MIIGSNFDYSARKYLDDRQECESLEVLNTNPKGLLYPRGFEVYCIKEKQKYYNASESKEGLPIWKPLINSSVDNSEIKEKVDQLENNLNKTNDTVNKLSAQTGSDEITIPTYWENKINTICDKVKEYQTSLGKQCSQFIFITDTHIKNNWQKSPVLISKIKKECGIYTVIDGGDIVTGDGNARKDAIIDDIKQHIELYGKDVLRTIGNHDACYTTTDGLYYKFNLTAQELYNQMMFPSDNLNNRVYGEDGNYYYVDDINNNIRYLILNDQDVEDAIDENGYAINNRISTHKYSTKQISWIENIALNTNKDIIVISHMPPINKTVRGGKYAETITNYEQVTILMDNYNRNENTGNIIGWFCGHLHEDFIVTNVNTFPIISIQSDSKTNGNNDINGTNTYKVSGTTEEQAFDVVTIDKKNKKIYLTRVGYGENREVSYDYQTQQETPAILYNFNNYNTSSKTIPNTGSLEYDNAQVILGDTGIITKESDKLILDQQASIKIPMTSDFNIRGANDTTLIVKFATTELTGSNKSIRWLMSGDDGGFPAVYHRSSTGNAISYVALKAYGVSEDVSNAYFLNQFAKQDNMTTEPNFLVIRNKYVNGQKTIEYCVNTSRYEQNIQWISKNCSTSEDTFNLYFGSHEASTSTTDTLITKYFYELRGYNKALTNAEVQKVLEGMGYTGSSVAL